MFSIFFDHHIIPERFRDHLAFRGIDRKMFDIDGPVNRIYLPANRELAAKLKVSPHPSRHVELYGNLVCKRLKEIATIENPDERLAKIKTLIDAMRVGFLNGDLYTNVPLGMTKEEVYQGVKKVLTDDKAYLDQHPDRLRTIRDVERRGADAGQDHLIKWLPYLADPERLKVIDEAIARNPGVNLTAGNRDLGGTDWSKFEASDPSSGILHIPGIAPVNPSDFPQLRGYTSPSLSGLTERLTQIDPRLSSPLPPFPAPDGSEKQFDRLPPSAAALSDPLVLKSDPVTGTPLPFYENPLAGGTSVGQNALPWLTGAAAVGLAAPFLPAWLLATGGALALSRAATAEEGDASATRGTDNPNGAVLSKGEPAYNILGNRSNSAAGTSGSLVSPTFASQLGATSSPSSVAGASSFADRFGNWTDTPAGTLPGAPANVDRVPGPPAGESAAPEHVRRLTRANESNAGSVFTSGSAPVPYLPSTEFSERFGNWTVPSARSGQPQPSKPIGLFADEPGYLIPPPIFGVNGPGSAHNDAEEWFSRWIRPLLPPT